MQVLLFTPGCLDLEGFRKNGTVAIMSLAASSGESEVSCLCLAPGGSVTVPPATYAQLYLVVNGQVTGVFDHSLRIEIWAGVGIALEASDSCRLESIAGAVLIAVESAGITVDPCGLSVPERVRGQPWPRAWSVSGEGLRPGFRGCSQSSGPQNLCRRAGAVPQIRMDWERGQSSWGKWRSSSNRVFV